MLLCPVNRPLRFHQWYWTLQNVVEVWTWKKCMNISWTYIYIFKAFQGSVVNFASYLRSCHGLLAGRSQVGWQGDLRDAFAAKGWHQGLMEFSALFAQDAVWLPAMTLQEGVRFLLGNFGDIDEEQSWRVEMLFQLKQENNLVFKRLQEDLCFVSTMFLYEVESVKLEVSCHLSATGHSQLCSMSYITGSDFSLFKAMQFSRLD